MSEVKAKEEAVDAGGADDTENGEQNVKSALAAKVAQMEAKKSEDKNGEKELSRMYKKGSKELKDQLEAIASDSERVKFLQQKYLDKMHQCNATERRADILQVPLASERLTPASRARFSCNRGVCAQQPSQMRSDSILFFIWWGLPCSALWRRRSATRRT